MRSEGKNVSWTPARRAVLALAVESLRPVAGEIGRARWADAVAGLVTGRAGWGGAPRPGPGAVRARCYADNLDTGLTSERRRWSADADAILTECVEAFGGSGWASVARAVGAHDGWEGRCPTEQSARCRWHKIKGEGEGEGEIKGEIAVATDRPTPAPEDRDCAREIADSLAKIAALLERAERSAWQMFHKRRER